MSDYDSRPPRAIARHAAEVSWSDPADHRRPPQALPDRRRTRRSGSTFLTRQRGLTGTAAVMIGLATAIAAGTADLVISDRLGPLFDVAFVLTAFGLASAVRRRDVFAVAVLPPLELLGALAVLVTAAGDRVAPGATSWFVALLTGLSRASWALVVAVVITLATIALRVAATRGPPTRTATRSRGRRPRRAPAHPRARQRASASTRARQRASLPPSAGAGPRTS